MRMELRDPVIPTTPPSSVVSLTKVKHRETVSVSSYMLVLILISLKTLLLEKLWNIFSVAVGKERVVSY